MPGTQRYDAPDPPKNSVLSLSEYLTMQHAVGEETRYRVLTELLAEGESRPPLSSA